MVTKTLEWYIQLYNSTQLINIVSKKHETWNKYILYWLRRVRQLLYTDKQYGSLSRNVSLQLVGHKQSVGIKLLQYTQMQYCIYSCTLILIYYTIIIIFVIYAISIYKIVHVFYIAYNNNKLFYSVGFNNYRGHNITNNIKNKYYIFYTYTYYLIMQYDFDRYNLIYINLSFWNKLFLSRNANMADYLSIKCFNIKADRASLTSYRNVQHGYKKITDNETIGTYFDIYVWRL